MFTALLTSLQSILKIELDKVLDLLNTEFSENMSDYTASSTFSDDKIIKE